MEAEAVVGSVVVGLAVETEVGEGEEPARCPRQDYRCCTSSHMREMPHRSRRSSKALVELAVDSGAVKVAGEEKGSAEASLAEAREAKLHTAWTTTRGDCCACSLCRTAPFPQAPRRCRGAGHGPRTLPPRAAGWRLHHCGRGRQGSSTCATIWSCPGPRCTQSGSHVHPYSGLYRNNARRGPHPLAGTGPGSRDACSSAVLRRSSSSLPMRGRRRASLQPSARGRWRCAS